MKPPPINAANEGSKQGASHWIYNPEFYGFFLSGESAGLSEYRQALKNEGGDVFVDDLRLREADAEEYAEGEPLARILAMFKRPEREGGSSYWG